MTQIKIDHWEKSFGDQVILDDVSLHIPGGSRVGIVGANGAGKTTLLRMILGEIPADRGQIKIGGESRPQYLAQNPMPVDGCDPAFFAMLKRLGGAYRQDWDRLSGGERKKLALAALFATASRLLLLDEPTNHLDSLSTDRLIALMASAEATVLFVSHDRYFLDMTADLILELEAGKIAVYAGNYSDYRQEKERRQAESRLHYEEERKKQAALAAAIRRKREWAQKAHRDSRKRDGSGNTMGTKEFRRAKAKKLDNQVKSAVKKLEKRIENQPEKPRRQQNPRFILDGGARTGRCFLRGEGLAKSFGDLRLFGPSDFYLLQGEKAALFGPNGCGKTTLFRILLGEETADAGHLWQSPALRPFYLSQDSGALPADMTVEHVLLRHRPGLSGVDRTDLDRLGITAAHFKRKIGEISYGERLRLRLGLAILERRDLLFLDEPTNHLDLPAREQLENALASYRGSLVVASHDLYFLMKVCDKVLWFDGGRLRRLEASFLEFWQESGGNFPL